MGLDLRIYQVGPERMHKSSYAPRGEDERLRGAQPLTDVTFEEMIHIIVPEDTGDQSAGPLRAADHKSSTPC